MAETTGVLIIRVWIEGDDDHPVRARLTGLLDVEGDEEWISQAATVDDILDQARQWLDIFAAGPRQSPP